MQKRTLTFKSDLRERCYKLSLAVITLTDTLPRKRSAWVIADQLIRAACSIGANLVEAKASSSRLEFKKFYEISLKSAHETLYWLNLLKDAHLADSKTIELLESELIEITNMLAAGVIKLKKKPL